MLWDAWCWGTRDWRREEVFPFSSRELLVSPMARSLTLRAPSYSSACYAGYIILSVLYVKYVVNYPKIATTDN